MHDTLESDLKRALPEWEMHFEISTMSGVPDLAWDPDMTLEELTRLDDAIIVDALHGPRRAAFQTVRGEVRYFLATARDPIVLNDTGETEMGTVASITDAATLCERFLRSDKPLRELDSPRLKWGSKRG
jgi:hypothetical protein